MSGMKISLDAAMRARDVSPSGRGDGNPPERDEAEADGTATDTDAAASEPSDGTDSEAGNPSAAAAERPGWRCDPSAPAERRRPRRWRSECRPARS